MTDPNTQTQKKSKQYRPRAGGYYATAGRDASILLRLKEDQDNAEPAASSVALANLARLAALAAPGSAPAVVSGRHWQPYKPYTLSLNF